MEKTSYRRHTVTAALPYANGPVHIGHLAGCYLPSDIYVRYLRLRGRDVLYICGSDEHGVGIALKAMQEEITPRELVEKYHPMIQKGFHDFGISFDVYSRTSSPVHFEVAQGFFKKLHEDGVFTKKVSRQFYDLEKEQFLADRYITGECPNCQYDRAYGDQCERCGKSLDPMDLINPKSALSGAVPEMRETEHWYLPLQNFQEWLDKWILEEHKEDWKNNVYGQCKSWLTQGLQERAVTRDLSWGVPVPLEGAEGKVLYVWFDAPIGYISAAKEWGEATGNDWEPYWKGKDTRLLHFIGKDNIVFHCIVFPAMLKAHGGYILPDNVPANEFLNIEGEKISTSRNWAVWLHEYMEDFPDQQDALRYVLTANAPETKDNDFTWKDFQAKVNNELAAVFGNLVNRVVVLTHKYFEGKVPAKGAFGPLEEALREQTEAAPARVAALLEDFKLREALGEVMNLARAANKYLTENEPWKLIKTDAGKTATVLHASLQVLGNLAILCNPFLPATSQSLRGSLSLYGRMWEEAGNFEILKEGQEVELIPILFKQIEDSAVAEQVAKLHAKRAANAAPLTVAETAKLDNASQNNESPIPNTEHETLNTSPIKPDITIDDFAKLDLRMATVLDCQPVPKADKLLQLHLDLGFEQRTVLSGIALQYKPEEMIGKQVCIVANLAPRVMRGITSQGMILMIQDEDGKLVLLQGAKEVTEGSVVA